ncbi:hypothetical protein BDV95DRAFT_610356 [Massariosphaeria phaeospora]|uniref:Uncharacterized protein n=1 Tax=Massariosphaeria phaeospora TaxID=100035 RepID=A0A7C8M4C5_9PLEO|nr:hypothetical protein BDV95DRAFT_610356 [Massariosphaeria phaeospora]
MPRPLLPAPTAWLQVLFRTLSLLTTLSALTNALYLSTTFKHSNTMLYAALLWTLALDNAEVIALTSKSGDGIARAHLCPLLTIEVLGIVFFLIGLAIGTELGDAHDMSARFVRAGRWLMYGIIGLHAVLITICLIDGCKHGRVRRRHRMLREEREQAWRGRQSEQRTHFQNRHPLFDPLEEVL